MLSLKISMKGLEESTQRMHEVRSRLVDMTPFYTEVIRYELMQAQHRIDEGGMPPWQPTKYPSNDHPILKDTGRLYESLDPEQTIQASARGAKFVDSVPYAGILQAGWRVWHGTTTVAGREFLFISGSDDEWIQDAALEWIINGELIAL